MILHVEHGAQTCEKQWKLYTPPLEKRQKGVSNERKDDP